MTELRLRIDGQEVRLKAEMVGGVLWCHYQGRNFSFDPRKVAATKRRAAAGGASEEIESPMPGKITKILKSPGASVAKGDAVIVMEAMKMEYTLKSEIQGTVAELSCQVGDQVVLGQRLVRFKAGGAV